MSSASDHLNSCPLCKTKITDEIKELMGIRHYARLNAMLPGKVAGMDIDWVLQHEKAQHALIIEFKPSKARLHYGQKYTLKFFRQRDCDVWVVVDGKYPEISVGVMDFDGFVREWHGPMTEDDLAHKLHEWWDWQDAIVAKRKAAS